MREAQEFPFDPDLHAARTKSHEGICVWADHDEPARAAWSYVVPEYARNRPQDTFAVCDDHRAQFRRWAEGQGRRIV
jgi:hypothetical protein